MSTDARRASRTRATKETTIDAELVLDGTGRTDVSTGLPFFDHMVEQLGKHAGFDLTVHAAGDLHVDAHHTVEDGGIVLGGCLAEALGGRAVRVEDDDRTTYHTAAAIAANHLVALIGQVERIAATCTTPGIVRERAIT